MACELASGLDWRKGDYVNIKINTQIYMGLNGESSGIFNFFLALSVYLATVWSCCLDSSICTLRALATAFWINRRANKPKFR